MSSASLWFLIPLTFAALLGILINSYVLLVVLFSRQHTSVNHLLLLHLGTLNLCLGATFLAFSAPGLAHDTWLSHGTLCNLHGFLFTILHPLVLWTVCGLNADRYYAIAAPLHYGHLVNPKKVFLCLGIGWIISLSFTVFPFVHIAPFSFNRGLGACVPNFQTGRTTLWYSAAYTAFTLLLPITLIICCNVKILMIARYHRHRIASAIYEVTLSAQVTITHQRNPFFVPTVTAPSSGGPKFRSRSPVSTVLQLLGSIVLLYVPYYSIILWESCITFLESDSGIDDHIVLYQVVLVLLTVAPTVNGILYGLKNKHLRKTFQNYWRKKITKSEVNQEIQARTPSTCGSRRQSLTPLGFFARPNIQRRLSETLLDGRREESTDAKLRIKRIASELSWRPQCHAEFSIPPSCSTTLQVPHANISECNLEIDLENLQLGGRSPMETTQSTKEQMQHKETLHLPIHSENHRDNSDPPATKRKKSFLYKFFGVDESKTPKILITRALSEDDYSKGVRESNKHSLSVSSSLSKWYHHSDYNLLRAQTKHDTHAMTKLLWNNKDPPEVECAYHYVLPANHLEDDSDSDACDNSDNSSGLYMNLDSFETIRTQSCDIDMQDMEQIESIETEFANCSYEEDIELQQKLADYSSANRSIDDAENIRIGNGELKLKGKDLKAIDSAKEHCNVDELVEIKQQEVVL